MELTVHSYSAAWRWYTQPANTARFIKACLAAGITKVILQCDATVMMKFTEEPGNIATGIASIRAAGIQVFASWNCKGTPGWDTLQDGFTLHQMTDFVFRHNVKYPNSRFAGIEFDWEPVAKSTMEQHAAHLEASITTIQTLRSYVLNIDGVDQSVASQGLPLWMFCDPRWGREVCAEPWRRLCALLDVVEMEHYRFGAPGAAEGISTSVAYNTEALAIVIQAGKKFTTIISCVESSKYSDEDMNDHHWETRYGLGIVGCMTAILEYAGYYQGKYPNNYIGGGYYYDIDSFLHFHMIQSMTPPTGTVRAGDKVTISYSTWRHEESYEHKVIGVMAEVVDADGNEASNSELIDVQEGAVTDRTIDITIPFDAAPGPARVSLSTYAVEYISPYAADTDPFWALLYYRDFSGYTSQLLALSIEELMAMAPADAPKGTLIGRRPSPILLQKTEWESGLTIEEAEMSVLKVINILLRVKSKVQVTSGDVVLDTDPNAGPTFNVTVKSNAAVDTPVAFSLSPAVTGVALVTTSGVAKAKAETVIPVQLTVGDLAEGEYALQCPVSA